MAESGILGLSEGNVNPFQDKDDLSDLVLVVEGKKLYVHRVCLALNSPVLKHMVYPEFPGKEEHEIELPGKKYEDIVEFLLHMYPVHSLRPLTERRLLALLPLAEEYQAEHIREKCHEFITRMSMQDHRQYTSTGSLLMYVDLCDRYNFPCWRQRFEEVVSDRDPHDITRNRECFPVNEQLMLRILSSAERNMQRKAELRREEQERLEREDRFLMNLPYRDNFPRS